MGDLPIGHLRSGETVVEFPVGIPGKSLASHIGIFATTGMGKSNLLQVLCAAAMAANGRYGLLVFDPHGEHRSALGRHPWAAQALRTYSDRRLPNTSTLRISLAELSVDDLRTAYEWSRPQEEALYELERHYSATLPRGGPRHAGDAYGDRHGGGEAQSGWAPTGAARPGAKAWPGWPNLLGRRTSPASGIWNCQPGSPSTRCRSCIAGHGVSSTCPAFPLIPRCP
jgi:hypothetical protein